MSLPKSIQKLPKLTRKRFREMKHHDTFHNHARAHQNVVIVTDMDVDPEKDYRITPALLERYEEEEWTFLDSVRACLPGAGVTGSF